MRKTRLPDDMPRRSGCRIPSWQGAGDGSSQKSSVRRSGRKHSSRSSAKLTRSSWEGEHQGRSPAPRHDLKFEEGKPLTFELHLRAEADDRASAHERFSNSAPGSIRHRGTAQSTAGADPRREATWTPVLEKPKPGDMVNVQIATAPRTRRQAKARAIQSSSARARR